MLAPVLQPTAVVLYGATSPVNVGTVIFPSLFTVFPVVVYVVPFVVLVYVLTCVPVPVTLPFVPSLLFE